MFYHNDTTRQCFEVHLRKKEVHVLIRLNDYMPTRAHTHTNKRREEVRSHIYMLNQLFHFWSATELQLSFRLVKVWKLFLQSITTFFYDGTERSSRTKGPKVIRDLFPDSFWCSNKTWHPPGALLFLALNSPFYDL